MMDEGKFISNQMNKMIHSIHKNCVIIYQKNQQYYSIDQDIYVYKGVIDFNYCYKNKRMVIFVTEDYLNYILKVFREYHIHYCVIQINYGYHPVVWYHLFDNCYDRYYKKGRRKVKNEKEVEKLITILRKRKDMKLLMKVDEYLDAYN